jgi:hypothetical protein
VSKFREFFAERNAMPGFYRPGEQALDATVRMLDTVADFMDQLATDVEANKVSLAEIRAFLVLD